VKKAIILIIVAISFFLLTGFEAEKVEMPQSWMINTDTGVELMSKDGPIGMFRVLYGKEVKIPQGKKGVVEIEGFLSGRNAASVVVEKLEFIILDGKVTTDDQTWFRIYDGVKKSIYLFSAVPQKVTVLVYGIARYKTDYFQKEYKTWYVSKEVEIEFTR